MGGGDPVELVAVDGALRIGRIVQEGDRAFVALGAKGPQHRDHWSDAASTADQQEAFGTLTRKPKVPLGGALPYPPGPADLLQIAVHTGGSRKQVEKARAENLPADSAGFLWGCGGCGHCSPR